MFEGLAYGFVEVAEGLGFFDLDAAPDFLVVFEGDLESVDFGHGCYPVFCHGVGVVCKSCWSVLVGGG